MDSENAPRVSVLMSVFNGERFLKRAVESILGQTFTDFEFLILDDGSTDTTWEILGKYTEKDTRIVLIRNEQNIGLTRSLNKGLRLAQGEYLARQDADDISQAQRLELQVKFLDAHPEVGVVGSALEIIDENGKVLAQRKPAKVDAELRLEMLIKNSSLLHTSILARTSLLKELGGYNENIRFAQDYDLWWRVSRKANLANLSEILVKWRESPGRISQARRQEQLECMFAISLGIMNENLKARQLDKEAYERFWWAYHGYIDRLQKTDLKILEPLWELMSSSGAELKATYQGLKTLVYNLMRKRKYVFAYQMLRILKGSLKQRLDRKEICKNLIRSLLPIRS